ncbi:MAG: leucine--tRNA ligase [Candidatus Harrisonbacteria bacterium CG10_big_fil_rev_8_21_14_0_10_44_23]|uniref:Leucine--tRNA ligase n=1 Tax=Candidatus Harrisonbacteria bacterium CG10_big_fil_rev_8_21_14_0_10_44_23 TaxID=1974585 RepID=A0A2H0UQT6_9BACT|nr:MAG: leucine--tRNA ligase [Candidatus Harrisonbacteria bacterium CG10_big_fil_rev_8_21_14_0_10_44_23]
MEKYNPKEIEAKWQRKWEQEKTYEAKNKGKKWYSLFEFPYPSGAGLHTGHIRSNTAMDIISRKRRMEGYEVLYPIGWDAFGLPTENYAIKTGISPQQATEENLKTFKRQLKSLGFSFDWSREVNTTDPAYYKWTQWIFLKFFEHGLAYKHKTQINWCPSCKIGLANEEVVAGKCERCGAEVVKKEKEQWMLKITAYADKLLAGLDELDFLPEIKLQQKNWIGRSEGAEIDFPVKDREEKIKVFTTRPDTLFGATYMVLAPEHPLLMNHELGIGNYDEVQEYIKNARGKTEIERTSDGREKTGVELKGVKAINPVNLEEIPIFIADYVLTGYGTGAIMAVPAHDERDFEFAKKFGLEIREVISGGKEGECFSGEGELVSSGEFTGMGSRDAGEKITKSFGQEKVQYKLRDWVFSRQRYWGEPIPLVFCERCAERIKNQESRIKNEGEKQNPGWIAVPDDELPVELPKVENYQPRDDGESPLASIEEWVNVSCPKCKAPAKRETDTMPNWAGSSWYFLRYIDPKNDEELASKKLMKHWLPVDWYNGGVEHVTLHLLYSRFWNQFLYDIKVVPVSEPYKKRTKHGMILAEGGVKMSKSKGNVVNPDPIVEEFGADSLRLYEMFMGPFDQALVWDRRGIFGTARFLERAWRAGSEYVKEDESKELTGTLHKLIKKVGEDIEGMNFNTAISSMMVYMNQCLEEKGVAKSSWMKFLQLLHPFAPHIASELYEMVGGKDIDFQPWPEYDKKLLVEESFELVVQINGKTRGTISAERGLDQKAAQELVRENDIGKKWIVGEVKKVIFVENRLINFIV